MDSVSVLHSTHERVAEKPERQAVSQHHGEVAVCASPAVCALEKPVVFRRALSIPLRTSHLCNDENCRTNSRSHFTDATREAFEL